MSVEVSWITHDFSDIIMRFNWFFSASLLFSTYSMFSNIQIQWTIGFRLFKNSFSQFSLNYFNLKTIVEPNTEIYNSFFVFSPI